MGDEITLAQLRRWLIHYADYIAQQEAYLTELDAAIGDADHGINMRRGTARLRQRLVDLAECEDVSTFLRTVAMTLIGSIGGAAGPLYGSFFLNAAKEASAHRDPAAEGDTSDTAEAMPSAHLAVIFRSGLEGVKQRGKARVGEKTMIDAMEPAVEAMELGTQQGNSLVTILDDACQAAKMGMQKTIDMQAKKGRASYLGPRSIGHQDPGATSTYYLFKTALESLVDEQQEVVESS